MSQTQFTQQAQKIQQLLDNTSHQIAHQSGFVKRCSKLTGSLFLKILLLGWLKNPRASLEMLAQVARRLGLNITAQGLAKRFHEGAVCYIEAVFQEVLKQFFNPQPLNAPFLRQFNGIYLVDSTYLELPKALKARWQGFGGCGSGAGLKLVLTWEYLAHNLQALVLTDGKHSDRLHSLSYFPVGSLQLFDLGFFKLETFETIRQAGAFYISRLKTNIQVATHPTVNPLGLESICESIQGQHYETRLWLGGKHQTEARAIFVRCPPDVAAERRRQARLSGRKHRWNPSERHLALLDWNIFITNLPAERLSWQAILQLYRLRWQIELLFKLCKSQLALDAVQGCGEHRLLVQLYCRLILLVLFSHLTALYRLYETQELSLPKAFALFSAYADFLTIACQQWHTLAGLLAQLVDDFLDFARKSKRRKSPSTLAGFLTQAF